MQQNQRGDLWTEDYAIYSEGQVEAVLERCGVEIVNETDTHFICLCPFHGNNYSPAFEIDKTKGLWLCFNPSCGVYGKIEQLPKRLLGMNMFAAMRLVIQCRDANPIDVPAQLAAVMKHEPEFTLYPQEILDRMRAGFKGSVGEDYMHGRGFKDETLDYFEIGYSSKRNMVTVPMHDPQGNPVGMIGRIASSDKIFKNTKGLPKSKTAWNFHRAKRHGDTVIICESSYDAMRVHQAGYPNVVALLGGHISAHHVSLLGKTFSRVIIMTDYDKKQFNDECRKCGGTCVGHRPGRDLGRSIAERLSYMKIMWAAFNDTCVYPHNAKDASDMTDEEIVTCLRGAISNLEYSMWAVDQ